MLLLVFGIVVITLSWNPDTLLDSSPLTHFYMHFVFWSSIINIALPPVEMFDKWPAFQNVYKALVNVVQYYCSLNFRGKIAQAYQNLRGDNINNEFSKNVGFDTGKGATGGGSGDGAASGSGVQGSGGGTRPPSNGD